MRLPSVVQMYLPPDRLTKMSGFPVWEIEYLDGSRKSESSINWERVPKVNTKALRLYCPDGQVAVVGNDSGATGRLFQFKIAEVRHDRHQLSVVIGMVVGKRNDDLVCICWIWDAVNQTLTRVEDTLPSLKFGGPVTQSMDLKALGVDPAVA